MPLVKRVRLFAPGRSNAVEVELIPGETVEQLIALAIGEFDLPPDGHYQIVGPDRQTIAGDVYKAVKEGDELVLGSITTGA